MFLRPASTLGAAILNLQTVMSRLCAARHADFAKASRPVTALLTRCGRPRERSAAIVALPDANPDP